MILPVRLVSNSGCSCIAKHLSELVKTRILLKENATILWCRFDSTREINIWLPGHISPVKMSINRKYNWIFKYFIHNQYSFSNLILSHLILLPSYYCFNYTTRSTWFAKEPTLWLLVSPFKPSTDAQVLSGLICIMEPSF